MRQPEPDFNPCENNGGCEALCLLVPSSNATGRSSRVCQCPENFILNSDGLTCASNCSSSSFNCKFSSLTFPQHKLLLCVRVYYFSDKVLLKGNDFIICIFQIQSPNFFLIISASVLASTIGQIIKSIIMCVYFLLFDPF